jgi:1-acyl-sn-glycerol-3-phosphate acyltransferase
VKPNPLAGLSLRFSGWQYEGEIPPEKKYVALAVPHTSNWDGLLLVAILQSIGLQMEWMVKDSWIKSPIGPVLRGVGAIGINRSKHTNVVDQMVEQFKKRDAFVLGIPPEGTRSRAEYWKSGFYHIARGADVPVVTGYLDFARKRAGLGAAIRMTGDVRADMDKIRAFYAAKDPKPYDPSKFGPIRLREEETSTTTK